MEHDTGTVLSNILTQQELEKIPLHIATKVEKYFDQRFSEFLTTKALYSAAQRNIEQLRLDYEKLSTNSQDKDAKIETGQQNAEELRRQLDVCKTEITSLSEVVQLYENEISKHRKERNDAFDERDQLQSTVDRQNGSIERLQDNLAKLEKQLDSATTAKCEALTKCLDIESREHNISCKQKFMDQERDLLTMQINNLTDNLHKASTELHAIQQENISSRMQLVAELSKKTNDLEFANSTLAQFIETNKQLTAQVEELNQKLLEQSEESTKLMEQYDQELMSKTKLAELYLENVNELSAENNGLKNAYIEMRKNLSETAESYTVLEAKLHNIDGIHQQELDAKNDYIQKLQDELKNANEDNLQDALERLTPTAASAIRRLKSNITLTDIYSLYAKAVEDLQIKDRDLKEADITLKKILSELEQLAPAKKQQDIDFQKVLVANEELSAQLEQYVNERDSLREELIETKDRFGHFERDNNKLKLSQTDLSRQVVYLLKEIEQLRGGLTSNHESSDPTDVSANEFISKRMVTFDNIVELQDNNQKLLTLVRDLTNKLDELEETQNNTNLATFEAQMDQYTRRVQELESTSVAQIHMIATCVRQKDRFKYLYYELMKEVGKTHIGCNDDTLGAGDIQMDASELDNAEQDSNQQVHNETTNTDVQDKTIAELEKKVEDYVSQLRVLSEEYDQYRVDKVGNEKLVNEQYVSMRNEVRELTANNCKLMTSAKFYTEQIKTNQNNIALYKNQIQTLEERNRIYDQTIAKQEATIKYLREQMSSVQKNCSSAELKCDELRRQCHKLVDDVSRLTTERESLYRERLSMNMLQNNLEMIKTTVERNENDSRMLMEKRYDDVQRECAALRRRLQDEQDHYRDKAAELKRQTETVVKKMQDELANSESLRSQIGKARQDIENKNLQIDELSHKLQESLTPSKLDNPIAKANKTIKELQNIVDQRAVEVEQLKRDSSSSNAKFEQLSKMAAEWEADSKEQHEIFEEYKVKMVAEVAAARQSETNLKSRVEEMETQIRLQIIGAQLTDTDTTTQLHKAQSELKEAVTKISETNQELRELRTECQLLKSSLQTAEQKYSNEIMLHSTDIQALTMCRDELNKVQNEYQKQREERDSTAELLKSQQNDLEISFEQHANEKKELELRLHDVDAQNAALHDQIQFLTASFAINYAGRSTGTSLPESLADSSIPIHPPTDEDWKVSNADQLMTVIKFMRKEKDIALAKLEISNSENIRLNAEAEILKKKLNELTTKSINSERPAAEINIVSALKYEEIMRKVETLNAITDSNRTLREERDALQAQVVSLTERVTQGDVVSLQETNIKLVAEIDKQNAKNNSLHNTVDQWRKRCDDLDDRSHKNPEELKRLQTKSENLEVMLSDKKETIRLLDDELKSIRDVNARLDSELSTALNNCQAHVLEKEKFSNELIDLKAAQQGQITEMTELKRFSIEKDNKINEITKDLAAAEANLVTVKDKETLLRRIAKRYKHSVSEQLIKIAELEVTIAAHNATAQNDSARITKMTNQIDDVMKELDQQRQDNDKLKKTESHLLNEARARIKALTETNNALRLSDQNRVDHDNFVARLKTHYEHRINQLEKEIYEQDASIKEVIARITSENDSLQLQLQQQGTIPCSSSIEKGPSDTTRTANVRPMGSQSTNITTRRLADTPLASIRPMLLQKRRTAAVMPTSQPSANMTLDSETDLAPPPDQVQSSSSSTTIAQATSSAVVATLPQIESSSAAGSSEESDRMVLQLQQQTVVLVSPIVQTSPQNVLVRSTQSQATSLSSGGLNTISSSAEICTHQEASSSNMVSTTQASAQKRSLDPAVTANNNTSPKAKRTTFDVLAFEGIFESGLDVEYQVPTTSSQRDQGKSLAMKDSEESDEDYCESSDMEQDEEGGSFNNDEGNLNKDTNVKIEDIRETTAQSPSPPPHFGNFAKQEIETSLQDRKTEQIQAISSESEARSPHQQSDESKSSEKVIIIQAFEDTAKDNIMPITSTLDIPQHADREILSVTPQFTNSSRMDLRHPKTVNVAQAEPEIILEIVICDPDETMDDSVCDEVNDPIDVSAESKEIQEIMFSKPNQNVQIEENCEAEASLGPCTRSRTPRFVKIARRGRSSSSPTESLPAIVAKDDAHENQPPNEDGQKHRYLRNTRKIRHPDHSPKNAADKHN